MFDRRIPVTFAAVAVLLAAARGETDYASKALQAAIDFSYPATTRQYASSYLLKHPADAAAAVAKATETEADRTWPRVPRWVRDNAHALADTIVPMIAEQLPTSTGKPAQRLAGLADDFLRNKTLATDHKKTLANAIARYVLADKASLKQRLSLMHTLERKTDVSPDRTLLIEALAVEDPKLVDTFCDLLHRYPDPTAGAVKPITDLLHREQPDVQRSACWLLIAGDPNRQETTDANTADALLDILFTPDSPVLNPAAEAFEKLAGKDAPAESLRALQTRGIQNTKSVTLLALAARTDTGFQLVKKMLGSSSYAASLRAANALAVLGTAEAAKELWPMRHAKDHKMRRMVLRSMPAHPKASELLIEALEDDWTVNLRREVLHALGHTGGQEAEATLAKYALNEDPKLALAAIGGLQQMKSNRLPGLLVEYIEQNISSSAPSEVCAILARCSIPQTDRAVARILGPHSELVEEAFPLPNRAPAYLRAIEGLDLTAKGAPRAETIAKMLDSAPARRLLTEAQQEQAEKDFATHIDDPYRFSTLQPEHRRKPIRPVEFIFYEGGFVKLICRTDPEQAASNWPARMRNQARPRTGVVDVGVSEMQYLYHKQDGKYRLLGKIAETRHIISLPFSTVGAFTESVGKTVHSHAVGS